MSTEVLFQTLYFKMQKIMVVALPLKFNIATLKVTRNLKLNCRDRKHYRKIR